MRSSFQANKRQNTAEKHQSNNGLRSSQEMAANYYQRIKEFNSRQQQKQNPKDRNMTAVSAGKKQIHSSLGRVQTETSYQRNNSNVKGFEVEKVNVKEQLPYHNHMRQQSCNAAKIGVFMQENEQMHDVKKTALTWESPLKKKILNTQGLRSQEIVEVDMSEFMQIKRWTEYQDNKTGKVEDPREFSQTSIPASSTFQSLVCSSSFQNQSNAINIPRFQHHSNDLTQNHLSTIKNNQTSSSINAEKNINSANNKENKNSHMKNEQINEIFNISRPTNPIIRSFTQPNANSEENIQESFTDYQQNMHNYHVVHQAEILPNIRKSREINTKLLPFFNDEFKKDLSPPNKERLTLFSTKNGNIHTEQKQRALSFTQQSTLPKDHTIQQAQQAYQPWQLPQQQQQQQQHNSITPKNLRYSQNPYDQTSIQFKIEQPIIKKEHILKEIQNNGKNQYDNYQNTAVSVSSAGACINQLVSPRVQFENQFEYSFMPSHPTMIGPQQFPRNQENSTFDNSNDKIANAKYNGIQQQNSSQQARSFLRTLSISKSDCFSLQKREYFNSAERKTMESQPHEYLVENDQLEKQTFNYDYNQHRVRELVSNEKQYSRNITDQSASKQFNGKYPYEECRKSSSLLRRNHSANKHINNIDYFRADQAKSNPREFVKSSQNEQRVLQDHLGCIVQGQVLDNEKNKVQQKNIEKIKLNGLFISAPKANRDKLEQDESNIQQKQQQQQQGATDKSQGFLDCQQLIHRLEEIQRDQQLREEKGGLYLDETIAQQEILELSNESSQDQEQVFLNNCSSQQQQNAILFQEQQKLQSLQYQQQQNGFQIKFQNGMFPQREQQYWDPEIKLKKPLLPDLNQQYFNSIGQDSHWIRSDTSKAQERRTIYSSERRSAMGQGQPLGLREIGGRMK